MKTEEIVLIREALCLHIVILETRLEASLSTLCTDLINSQLNTARKALEVALRMS